MDGLGPIDIQILIDNPQLLASLRQGEASVQNSVNRMQSQTTAAGARVASAVTSSVASVTNSTGVMIERLKIQLAQLIAQRDLTGSGNAGRLIALNQQIDNTQAQITRMSNAGRTGFDALGNAVAKNTNLVGTAWGAIRKLAYILPGVGYAGIIAFAVGPIIEYISKLDIFKGKLDQATANLKALNDVNKETAKDAGKQITNLQILYKAATDVNNSMSDRVRYAEQIRATYPQSFANSTAQAILNGQEAKSYDQLSKSIIDQARAKAVADKEGALAATIVEAQFQKAKIESARKAKIDKVYSGEGRSIASIASNDSYIGVINYDAEKATKAQDDIIKLAKQQIKFVENFAGGSAKVADTITKGTNLIQEPLKNFDALVNKITQKADIENIKAALEAKMKALAPNDKQLTDYRTALTKLTEIEKAYNPKTDDNNLKTDNSQQQTALRARRSALEKIASINREFDRKALDANEEQIQAIRDKFTVLRNEINQANIIIDKANANIKDPKKKISRVSSGNIDGLQQIAINNQLGLQDFDYYKNDLAQQKKLFDDFEEYKLKVGSVKAKERFAIDLNGNDSYIEYLRKELSSDRIDPNDKSAGTAQRKKLLEAELAKELAVQQENYTKLLEGLKTYETDRSNITDTYYDKRNQLIAKGNFAEVEILDQQYKEQLDKLDDAHISQLDAVKQLFSGIQNLSSENAKKLIADVQSIVDQAQKAGTATPAVLKKVQDAIAKATGALNNRLPANLKAAGQELSAMAGIVGQLNESLAQTLGALGNIVTSIGEGKGAFDDFMKASKDGDTFGQIGAVIGMVKSAIGVISSIGNLFSSAKQDAEQRAYAYDLQLKAVEAVNKALERQVAITKELYGTARLESYKKDIQDIAQAQQDAAAKLNGLYSLSGNKVIDEQITKLNKGEQINEFVYRGMIEAAKRSGAAIDLTTQSLEQLTKLMDEGKLDDKTSAIVQSMISLEQQAKDTANALKEEVTGTSFDSLKDAITSLFESGEASAENLGKALEKAIDSAILNSFERTQVEKAMQPFFDALYAAGLDGSYTDAEIAALRAQKEEIAKNLEKQADAYKAIAGIDADEASGDPLAKGIQGITQDEASVLSGTTKGIQLAVLQLVTLSQNRGKSLAESIAEQVKHTLLLKEISVNTKSTADNTASIDKTMTVAAKTLDQINEKMSNNVNALNANGRTGI